MGELLAYPQIYLQLPVVLPVPADLVVVVVPGEGQQGLGAAPHPALEALPPGRGEV